MKDLIISIKEARKLLGEDAKSMTDQDIENLIHDMEWLSRLAVRSYLSRLRAASVDLKPTSDTGVPVLNMDPDVEVAS